MLILKSQALDGTTHGFFGRSGGVSDGLYASLNCGPGSRDARANVIENRRRVREALGADALVTLGQVHSPDVVTVRYFASEHRETCAIPPCLPYPVTTPRIETPTMRKRITEAGDYLKDAGDSL